MEAAIAAMNSGEMDRAFEAISAGLDRVPFAASAGRLMSEAAKRIISIEEKRGEIKRTERSSLDAAAQPYQDLIDRILFAMADLTQDEAALLQVRLEQML
jgi:hypothetical protein